MKEFENQDMEAIEERINDLLEGRLDDGEAERLKREAQADHELATAIIDAYQLQRAMSELSIERAPASLRRRLKKIPAQSRPAWQQPRWVMAYATVPVLALAMVMMQPSTPSASELEQARQDLAVAFAYIDRVSVRTTLTIQSEIGSEMSRAVAEPILESINEQEIL
ncbi:MAG: hypothetical protein HKO64_09125 [Xanthomonadales bacterium]|nr:hypothetical protein [Gammaproteobacteria bacterium]NNE04877.1 hypothetical protein [Xanthomonadales bacterium]NNL95768.1 hypothetical protein [Xanthomonadales bacterium]